jgi:HlyD family secretion protein
MTANISIITSKRENVVKVPNAALRFHIVDPNATPAPAAATAEATPPPSRHASSGRTHAEKRERTVYVMPPGGGKPAPVQVKVGFTDGTSTEVTEGLKEGDVVVTGEINPEAEAAHPASNPFGTSQRRY